MGENDEITRSAFKAAGKVKTQAEISKENKIGKENKKDVKDIMRNNKEAIEEMSKMQVEASGRMEKQLSKMSQNLIESNQTTQNSVNRLTSALQNILLPKENNRRSSDQAEKKRWTSRVRTTEWKTKVKGTIWKRKNKVKKKTKKIRPK